MEPLGSSRELVGALSEAALADTLQGRSEDAISQAERALQLAEELGLPRPARAVGIRGLARSGLGDPRGLHDYREAIVLASQAGNGREAALLHNNLGFNLWAFGGPVAALEVLRQGITFSLARGLTAWADSIRVTALDPLVDTGGHAEVFEVAADLTSRLEASGDVFDLCGMRAARVRIAALQGETAGVSEMLDWLETSARSLGQSQSIVLGLGSSAIARSVLGQDRAAAGLLVELEAYPGVRDSPFYPALLPAMVRTALGLGELDLAERLLIGLESRYPYAEHALVGGNAAITQATGDFAASAEAYAEASDRWERFGVVPEQAFALLGQGRCFVGLSSPTEAAPVLQHARELFERLHAAPAVAETRCAAAAGHRAQVIDRAPGQRLVKEPTPAHRYSTTLG